MAKYKYPKLRRERQTSRKKIDNWKLNLSEIQPLVDFPREIQTNIDHFLKERDGGFLPWNEDWLRF